jgi:arginyl-tRNA synthetase
MGKQVAILTWGEHNKDKYKNELKNYPPAGSAEFSFKNNTLDHEYVIYYQISSNLMKKNEEISCEINEIVKKLEEGDNQTLEDVHKSYSSVLEGMKESMKALNIVFDRFIPESRFVKNGSVNAVIEKLKQLDYCGYEDGAYFLDLKSFGIKGRNTKFFFQRKDGTSLYATRDIAYHQWKAKQADILVNVLGEDHKLQSKQVQIALKLLKTKVIPQVVFYAFVSLPGGKMSTRRGRVVYLDELIDECIKRAYDEVKKRRGNELSEKQMKKIAEFVGIGAMRYNIIKVQPEKDIVFRWEDALNFEGNAIPFIQYAHARACSILSKCDLVDTVFDPDQLSHDSEQKLIKQLAHLPLVIEDACSGCKPNLVANYLFETASEFNQFYRDCPVLSEKNPMLRKSRLTLVDATRIVLKNALSLLGIHAPEEM